MIDNYYLQAIASYQRDDTSLSNQGDGKAVGPCPVKVIGISPEKLRDIYRISPELEAQMRAIAGHPSRAIRVEKY
jgi:hypothetical protein